MSETRSRLPWWRKLVTGFLGTLVTLLILVGLPLTTLAQLLTDRDSLLGVIQDQRLYATVKANALAVPVVAAQEEGAEAVAQNLADLEVYRQLFDNYLTYETYQRLTGEFVNGIYQWLEGTTPRPDFELKLADSPADFTKLVADLLIDRYNDFPPCTTATPLEELFTAECRDPRITAAQLRRRIAAELKTSDVGQGIATAKLSSADLFQDADPEVMANAPRYFQAIALLPWLLLAAVLSLSGLMFLAVWQPKSALKKIGWTWLIPSGLMLLAATSWWQFDRQVINQFFPLGDNGDQNAALGVMGQALAERLFASRALTLLWFSLALVSAAVAMLVGSHFIGRNSKPTIELAKAAPPTKS